MLRFNGNGIKNKSYICKCRGFHLAFLAKQTTKYVQAHFKIKKCQGLHLLVYKFGAKAAIADHLGIELQNHPKLHFMVTNSNQLVTVFDGLLGLKQLQMESNEKHPKSPS